MKNERKTRQIIHLIQHSLKSNSKHSIHFGIIDQINQLFIKHLTEMNLMIARVHTINATNSRGKPKNIFKTIKL